MYRILRDTHLLLGLFLLAFVLLFSVSSIRFAHRDWFEDKPTETHLTIRIDPGRGDTPRALARHLMQEEEFRGGLNNLRETDEGIRFNISRMGTIHEVRYQRGASEASVEKRVFPFIAMLTWMHTTFGIDHDYWLHNVWGWLMLFTSIGLLVLGGTGIYLWFKIFRERLVGSVLLLGNLAYGVCLILLLWVA